MAKKTSKPDDTPESEAPKPPVSKAVAARAALEEGHDNPQIAVKWIMDKFGVEMSPAHFSAVKANEKKKLAKPAVKKGRPAKASQAVEGYLAPPAKKRAVDGDLLDAIEAMKPLVASLGVEKVKRIAELLG